jgi:hypothetical protein
MRYLILSAAVILMASCSSQKRCSRFVARHPDCFVSTDSITIDTIIQELEMWDTTISTIHDTSWIPSPCGEIMVITDPQSNRIKLSQRPLVPQIKETRSKHTQLPCPCDCEALKKAIGSKEKELKKMSRSKSFSVPVYWLIVAVLLGYFVRSLR